MPEQGTKRAGRGKALVQVPMQASSHDRLLDWYDEHRRSLPWRAQPGEISDPYAVWLSEVMLQQTTVAAVKSYFTAFLALWPRVDDLAAAPLDEVLKRWAGLGYYSRARNLHACARQIVTEFGGRFPATESELLDLPGIGRYTAAAISAIAFGRRSTVVDGNVERVIARLHGIDKPIRSVKGLIRDLAEERTPPERPGDYAQAMMDLGATVCTPRKPVCILCPLSEECEARRSGRQSELPMKAPRSSRAERFGSVFFAVRADEVLVRTRPANGLLGGMTEFPGSAWGADGDPDGLARPVDVAFRRLPEVVRHAFTHFDLSLTVFVATVPPLVAAPWGSRWVPLSGLAEEALPTLMRKVAVAAHSSEDR